MVTRRPTSTGIARGGLEPTLLESVATTVAVLLALAGWGRLTSDSAWWPATVLAVLSVTVCGALLRRTSLPAGLIPLVQFGVFVTTQVIYFGRDAPTDPGSPDGPGAATALGDRGADGLFTTYRETLLLGIEQSRDTVAPTAATPGLSALIAVVVFLAALLVETLVVGLGHAALSGIVLLALVAVPMGILPGGSVWLAVLGALGWLILVAVNQDARDAGRTHPGPSWRLVTAAVIVMPVLLMVVVTPALPPGGGAAWLRSLNSELMGRDGGGAATGIRVDPLVSVREQLVGASDREILRYRAEGGTRHYVRLATLRRFDGITWSQANPQLGPPVIFPSATSPRGAASDRVEIEVADLSNASLPVPLGTRVLEFAEGSGQPVPWRWDDATGDAIATAAEARGTRFAALLGLPSATREQLLESGVQGSPDPLADIVPMEVRGAVDDLAREITDGAGSPFEQAVALQDWFTDEGGFTYSLEVPDPGLRDPTAAFLVDRVGYCQQFASTMAVMARTLGIPARVVVGFAPGTQQGDGWVVVRGGDAHAWPELWFADAGWVRFEPTPAAARTSFEAPGYTASPGSPVEDDPEPGAQQEQPVQEPDAALEPGLDGQPADESTEAGSTADPRSLWWLGLLGLVGLAVSPMMVRLLRRSRRLRLAERGDVLAAWEEIEAAAIDRGTARAPNVTAREFADSLSGGASAEAAQSLGRLVDAVERRAYTEDGANGAGDDAGDDARNWGGDTRTLLKHLAPGGFARVRANLVPASLLVRSGKPSSARERVSQRGVGTASGFSDRPRDDDATVPQFWT